MPKRDIIVVGASAGGVEALTYLVKYLPPDLDAAIFIVLHIPSWGTSALPSILSRAGKLPAVHAKNGQAIQRGHLYVAPPNYHLLIKSGYVELVRSARENNHRPAIDPLFRSAARAYGQKVIGVILTGVLDDGTAGLQAVKIRGGTAIVQNPGDAMYSGMPCNAIEYVKDVDYILPLSEIPTVLIGLVKIPVYSALEDSIPQQMEIETDLAEMDMTVLNSDSRAGQPSAYACPDCGGTLWEIQEKNLLRFRCRVGHTFSDKTLLAKQSDTLEDALWIALRALEEKASLAQRMAKRMRDLQDLRSAERLEEQVRDIQAQATVIREVLLRGDTASLMEEVTQTIGNIDSTNEP